MTKSENNVTAIVTIDEICNHHLYAGVKCMNLMIDNQVPTSQAEIAYVMEVMTKVAEQQLIKNGEANDKAMFKLKLDEKSAVCLWNCLNVALANGMITAQGQQVFVSQLMSKIAIKLDQLIVLMNSPQDLIEKGPLSLVEDEPNPAPLLLVEE